MGSTRAEPGGWSFQKGDARTCRFTLRACGFALRVLMCLPACLSADVFWRRPADLPAGWTAAYRAPVRLQEGRGEMQIFGVPGRIEGIGARLRREHGDNLVWMEGEKVAWGLAVQDGWVHRYLVQPRPPEEGGFWVTALRQRLAEAGRPGAAPATHRLREIPAFPQSEPMFYSLDEGNRSAVEVSRTRAAPEAVLDQLSAALVSDGWLPSPLNTGGFRIFVRRDRVAAVSASRGEDGFTRVVRLHKPLGVE